VRAPLLQLRTQSVSKAYTGCLTAFINACFSTEKILALLFVYIRCRRKKRSMESKARVQLKKERTSEFRCIGIKITQQAMPKEPMPVTKKQLVSQV